MKQNDEIFICWEGVGWIFLFSEVIFITFVLLHIHCHMHHCEHKNKKFFLAYLQYSMWWRDVFCWFVTIYEGAKNDDGGGGVETMEANVDWHLGKDVERSVARVQGDRLEQHMVCKLERAPGKNCVNIYIDTIKMLSTSFWWIILCNVSYQNLLPLYAFQRTLFTWNWI